MATVLSGSEKYPILFKSRRFRRFISRKIQLSYGAVLSVYARNRRHATIALEDGKDVRILLE